MNGFVGQDGQTARFYLFAVLLEEGFLWLFRLCHTLQLHLSVSLSSFVAEKLSLHNLTGVVKPLTLIYGWIKMVNR